MKDYKLETTQILQNNGRRITVQLSYTGEGIVDNETIMNTFKSMNHLGFVEEGIDTDPPLPDMEVKETPKEEQPKESVNTSSHREEIIFKLSSTTPYTSDDIIEFMKLTDLSIDDTEKIIIDFNKIGGTNLNDVIKIIQMGHFQTPKENQFKGSTTNNPPPVKDNRTAKDGIVDFKISDSFGNLLAKNEEREFWKQAYITAMAAGWSFDVLLKTANEAVKDLRQFKKEQ